MENTNKNKKEFTPVFYSKDDMDKIIAEMDENYHQFIKEGKYKDVLLSMGNLGKYSFTNQMLILSQNDKAKCLNGMKSWNYFKRKIRTGEKAIKIIAPQFYTKEELIKLKESGENQKGGNLETVVENPNEIKGYIRALVFDISQTEGEPIDTFDFDEKTVVEKKAEILKAISKVAEDIGYKTRYAGDKELADDVSGECDHKNKEIIVKPNLCDTAEVSVTVHETAHALAHSFDREDFKGLKPKDRREIKEIEAESIACIVNSKLGLDTSKQNFAYIAGWSDGDISKFKNNLQNIGKFSQKMISKLEEILMPQQEQKKEQKTKRTAGKKAEAGME